MKKFVFILFLVLSQSSCNGNFFKELATKTSDSARYEDALKSIDTGDYDSAIASILATSTAYQADSKVIQTLAGAYAGKCGQDFISIISGMSASAGAPFTFFMNIFTTISVVPASCSLAQTQIERLGATAAVRTTDQNIFMFILGISKIGTYLKSVADVLPATGVGGDGTTDAGFSSCRNQASMTDAQVKQVITGLGLVLDNVAAVGASVSGSAAITAISNFNAACVIAVGGSCTITDVNSASITTALLDYFRELIMTSDFGIGAACTSAQALPVSGVSTTCCP